MCLREERGGRERERREMHVRSEDASEKKLCADVRKKKRSEREQFKKF